MCVAGKRAYMSAWYAANPHKVADYEANKDRDKVNANARSRYAKDPEPKKRSALTWARANPIARWAYQIKRLYGLTPEAWIAMFEKQGRVCAICGRGDPGERNWAVDHDHTTGRVRGILCHACNLLLGRLGDTAEAVSEVCARMLRYLGEPRAVSGG